MSWTDYTVQIHVRVSLHDEAEVSPDCVVTDVVRRCTDAVEYEVAAIRAEGLDGVEVELA